MKDVHQPSPSVEDDTAEAPKFTDPCPPWCSGRPHDDDEPHFRQMGGWYPTDDTSVEMVLIRARGDGHEAAVRVMYGPDWARRGEIRISPSLAGELGDALALLTPVMFGQFVEALRRSRWAVGQETSR